MRDGEQGIDYREYHKQSHHHPDLRNSDVEDNYKHYQCLWGTTHITLGDTNVSVNETIYHRNPDQSEDENHEIVYEVE